MRTIFVEKLFSKSGGEITPEPFSKKSKLSNKNLWINSLKFHTVCFYCMPGGALSGYIKTKLRTTCFNLI